MESATGGGDVPRFLLTGIYALVEPQRHPGSLAAYANALVAGGIRLVQIRAKPAPDLAAVRIVCEAVHAAGGIVLVNDDLAGALAADGIHLGQEDLASYDPAALRAQLGGRILGLSCGTPAEALAVPAALRAAYLGVGPIFATGSKADAGGPIGVSGVRAVVAATALPVAAIGGIARANLGRVRESGAVMAAMISSLANAADPAAEARACVAAWNAR
jgi:thiamine-phosphate diphosphorylase